MRLVGIGRQAGTAGIPEVSRVTPIPKNRYEKGRLLVADFPPAASGHIPPSLPTTDDPIGRVYSNHVVHAVAGGEAKVNCMRFAHPSGVPCKVEG